jgi:uncharacterized membrane protein (UPF0127 family)
VSIARVRTAAGDVICERCEIPESSFGRMRGLLGRSGLEPGGGMLIDAAPSVHMFFMRFPIDVVFLDRDWTVVRVVHALKPWRVAGARRAVAALELPAGTAAEAGLEEGDVLVLDESIAAGNSSASEPCRSSGLCRGSGSTVPLGRTPDLV